MGRWKGRVALVTGAGAGIGLSIAEQLTSHGMKVVACARNIGPIEELNKKLGNKGNLFPYKCDLQKDDEIDGMFKWIEQNLQGTDVCVNNAGYSTSSSLMDITPKEMREMLDTNVVALAYCAQQSIKSMIERGVNDGHVININATLGHVVLGIFNFYAATKFAVTALSQGFRKEMLQRNSHIKISSISPGRTETKFLHTSFGKERAEAMYSSMISLQSEDVTNSLLHVLATPPHVHIGDIHMESIEPMGRH